MQVTRFARFVVFVYVLCCSRQCLREQRATLILKRRFLLKQGGQASTIALIDAFMELSFPRAMRKSRSRA
jgi:hypothetical protein